MIKRSISKLGRTYGLPPLPRNLTADDGHIIAHQLLPKLTFIRVCDVSMCLMKSRTIAAPSVSLSNQGTTRITSRPCKLLPQPHISCNWSRLLSALLVCSDVQTMCSVADWLCCVMSESASLQRAHASSLETWRGCVMLQPACRTTSCVPALLTLAAQPTQQDHTSN